VNQRQKVSFVCLLRLPCVKKCLFFVLRV